MGANKERLANKKLHTGGCLKLIEATISQCFVLPIKKELKEITKTRKLFAKNSTLLGMWAALAKEERVVVETAIINFNNRLLNGQKVHLNKNLRFYLKNYGVY